MFCCSLGKHFVAVSVAVKVSLGESKNGVMLCLKTFSEMLVSSFDYWMSIVYFGKENMIDFDCDLVTINYKYRLKHKKNNVFRKQGYKIAYELLKI